MLSSIRNLPIAAKIYAALAVLAVTACIVAIAAFSGFSAIKAASEEVNASADRVEQAGEAQPTSCHMRARLSSCRLRCRPATERLSRR